MFSIEIVAENALIVRHSSGHLEADHNAIQALTGWLHDSYRDELCDVVPAFTSLTVYTQLARLAPQQLRDALQQHIAKQKSTAITNGINAQTHTFPCYYGREVAWDLMALAEGVRLEPEEVVRLHTGGTYRVYALGFTPGFPYLGGLDPRIAQPRRDRPRKWVPAGAVGIAGQQTGIYPSDSPGGWNIIGRCPEPLFHPESLRAAELCRLKTGDLVCFEAVTREQYLSLGGTLDGLA